LNPAALYAIPTISNGMKMITGHFGIPNFEKKTGKNTTKAK
jgi:hypothetical protein